ncbi:hypothetical protein TRAPUB_877 [Trametes pubescens]|uniref:F-box domain-containing protein n=1 Tax=Trametes pubescens TaxID=154538 RepID=A0A1M2VKS6_TRAPU|nr:hypothetical protein TRAPUB_877 [Trametes pubescens]
MHLNHVDHPLYQDGNRTATSRLVNRLWEYPPRAPAPPGKLPGDPKSLNIRLQTRNWSAFPSAHQEETSVPSQELTSIRGLPLELLLRVFSLCAEHPYRGDTPPIRGIAKLMLICLLWRTLILDTSSFCLYKGGPYWMLHPLFDAGMPALEVLELAPMHAFKELVSLLAPAIESGGESEVTPAASFQWPAFEHSPFQSRVQPLYRLRVLRLTYVWPMFWCCACSISTLLHIIAHNSSLQELSLHLHHDLSQVPPLHTLAADGRKYGAPQLFLRNLQTLSLHGTYSSISTIMRYIDFPGNIPNVDIRVRHTSTDDELTEEIVLDLLLPRFRPVLERMTDVMLAGDRSLGQARLYSPRPSWPWSCTGTPDAHLGFSWEDASVNGFWTLEARLRALAQAMETVPVRRLTMKLSVAHLHSYNTDWAAVAVAFWAAVFDAFPSLEHLCVIVLPVDPSPELRTDLLELLRALLPARQVPRSNTGFADVWCPLLTRLSIHS